MKIALLTSPRTGSTALYDLILKHLDFNSYTLESEPFNYVWRTDSGLEQLDINFFADKTNVFIKTFVGERQIPLTFSNNPKYYWNWFFMYFDKIILLDRTDKLLQSESLLHLSGLNNIQECHKKQYYNYTKIPKHAVEDLIIELSVESEKLFEYSQIGFPLFYYEDIFINKSKRKVVEMFEYIGITLNDSLYKKYILSSELKVRKTLI